MIPKKWELVLYILYKLADVEEICREENGVLLYSCIFCGNESTLKVIHDDDCVVTLSRKLKEMRENE